MPLSALSGFGIENLLRTILRLREQLNIRVPTATLNKALEGWLEQYSIPSRGRNAKIRYITQVQAAPVRFVCFANQTRRIPRGYLRYLENRIRESFGFSDIPISVEVREGRR